MVQMKILDLFCGGGGAAVGFNLSGFDVVGVDNKPQPHYPFPFILGDALDALARMIAGEKFLASDGNLYGLDDFVAIHSSPPCQCHTALKYVHQGDEYKRRHQDLIPQTRALLKATGKHYVIENVMLAPMEGNVVILCGTYFGLKVYRHRQFETSWFMLQPPHIPHHDSTPGNGRGLSPKGFISVAGHGGLTGYTKYAGSAMGIDWMTRNELSQAIPPAYTRWIGEQLIRISNA